MISNQVNVHHWLMSYSILNDFKFINDDLQCRVPANKE